MSTTPPPGASSYGNSNTGTQGSGAQGPGAQGSGAGRCFEEAVERIGAELKQAVAYVNDRVVPEVRRESIVAMRSLSETLRNLADRVERAQAAQQAGTPPRGPQP